MPKSKVFPEKCNYFLSSMVKSLIRCDLSKLFYINKSGSIFSDSIFKEIYAMKFAITIVSIGKKNDLLDKEVLRYMKLLSPFASMNSLLIKPLSASENQERDLQIREGKLLQSKWPPESYPVALSEEGKPMTSIGFSRWLYSHLQSNRKMTFTIGGAYGLSLDVKRQCKEVVSLSSLTLPHKLCMVVLIEQIYRAFTILHHHPYHK
jgi:23S rRNA (pseudouridine1915-N3)-methyltransferase